MDAVLTKPLTRTHALEIIKTFIATRNNVPLSNRSNIKQDLPDNESELFQLEQFALLDDQQALKNFSDKKVLIEMLTLLLQKELPADLAQMKKAYEIHDYSLVEKIAHKIKGGAVYVGTTRMKYACQYLERYWKTGEKILFEPLYQQAIQVIEKTCLYIREWLRLNSKI
jgi:HPt (histidine-containing phosphotransfer) domain-containing protein